jgi:hypothetical protein
MAEKKHISFTMLQILQEESDADHVSKSVFDA